MLLIDGDRRTDAPRSTGASGAWWIQSVKTGLTTVTWGASGDLPVQAAYWP